MAASKNLVLLNEFTAEIETKLSTNQNSIEILKAQVSDLTLDSTL